MALFQTARMILAAAVLTATVATTLAGASAQVRTTPLRPTTQRPLLGVPGRAEPQFRLTMNFDSRYGFAIDGDTLRADYIRVRFRWIDTPERNEPGFDAATRHLLRLTEGKAVSCAISAVDKYRRLIAACFVDDGRRHLGLEMVRAGMARAVGALKTVEADAQKARRGLWSCDRKAPKKWERVKRKWCSGQGL